MECTQISHDEYGENAECVLCGDVSRGRAIVQLPGEARPRMLACCKDCSSLGELLENEALVERAAGHRVEEAAAPAGTEEKEWRSERY